MLKEAKSAGFQHAKGFAFLPDVGSSLTLRFPCIPVPQSQAAAVLHPKSNKREAMHTCAKKVSQVLVPDLLSKSFCAAQLLSRSPCSPDVRAIALLLSWSCEMRSAVSLGHLYIPCIVICSQGLFSNCLISPFSNEPYTICSLSVDIYPVGTGGSWELSHIRVLWGPWGEEPRVGFGNGLGKQGNKPVPNAWF